MSFFPLSLANPADISAINERVAARIEQRKSSGTLPPGLAEQLDLQLAVLRNDSLPDMELVLLPSFYPALCL
jgi:hypothetical protein